jgi:hypothetical protein
MEKKFVEVGSILSTLMLNLRSNYLYDPNSIIEYENMFVPSIVRMETRDLYSYEEIIYIEWKN